MGVSAGASRHLHLPRSGTSTCRAAAPESAVRFPVEMASAGV